MFGVAVAVFVAGGDARNVDQQRREGLAAPLVAADRQRAECVAVVALAARQEGGALRLAGFQPVLAGQFERGLHGFRAAGDQVDLIEVAGGMCGQVGGQLFGGVAGEEGGVAVGVAVDLGVHGGQHVGVGVAERGDGGAAAGVEIGAAGAVGNGDAGGVGGDRWRSAQVAVDDVAHGVLSW